MNATALFNHLWQSTAFAAIAGLLTLVLRNNSARVRHALWFAASLKFLLPISILMTLGGHISLKAPAPQTVAVVTSAMDELSQPFSTPLLFNAPAQPPARNPLPAVGLAIWLLGFLGITCSWIVRWRRIRTVVGSASPLPLEIPIKALSSPTLLEPGIFGIHRPILILPAGIENRLTPQQLQAVIAHELCHARHRDNLIAAIHMFIETVFWFHPLIWWIGKRMLEEREGACDEEVLRLRNEPRTYAEGILNVCKHYAETPLPCVSGITGPNLRERIEAIMANRTIFSLNTGRKLLLWSALALAVATPIAIGLVNSSRLDAQTTSPNPFSFEAVSIKPFAPSDSAGLTLPTGYPNGRFVAKWPLIGLLSFAWRLPLNPSVRLVGVPAWASQFYDVEATSTIPADLSTLTREDRMRLMVQTMLADRFHLAMHRESKEMPVYALVSAKGGPKLQPADIAEKDCPDVSANPRSPSITVPDMCHQLNGGQGRGIHARAVTMSDLATFIENWTDRPLLNKTGITGLFRIETKGWQPMNPNDQPPPGANTEDRPSLYEIFDQLGLKMESQKDKAEVYVIDHIEKPTAN